MSSVLLLGASSDMATAIARKFAQDKFDIILAGRNVQQLSEFKTDLEIRYNIKSAVVFFDATDFASHESFYKNLPFHPDITVCIFGYLGVQQKAAADWKETENIIQANFTGAVSILNIVAEDYKLRKSGIIAGISSVAGERGRQSNYIYGSAKAGFTAYLSGLRNSLHQYGVHVITILPGFVYTKMTADLKLPPLLTATPEQVALQVSSAVKKRKNVVYVKWMWRWIMLTIKTIPEGVFKKLKL